MNFLNPFFLVALAGIAIPVILHLINLRRPKKVDFSSLRFFEEMAQKTIRRIKIKEYLLLLLRFLAVASLAIALARPFISTVSDSLLRGKEPLHYVFFVDNSPSMNQINEQGALLEQAKTLILTIAESADENDRFTVIPTNAPVSAIQTIARNEVQAIVPRLETSAHAFLGLTHFRRLLSADESNLPSELAKVIYWIGDGQASIYKSLFEDIKKESIFSKTPINWIQIPGRKEPNAAVTGLQFVKSNAAGGNRNIVVVNVKNFGDSPLVNAYLQLSINDNERGEYALNLAADEQKEFNFQLGTLTEKNLQITAKLDGDPWTFDNSYFLNITQPDTQRIVSIRRGNVLPSGYFDLALRIIEETNPSIRVVSVQETELSPELLLSGDALIVDGPEDLSYLESIDLNSFIQSGHGILILPNQKANPADYNALFQRLGIGRYGKQLGDFASFTKVAELAQLKDEHPLFTGLFESGQDERVRIQNPDFYHYWAYQPSAGLSLPIMISSLEDVIFAEERIGDGSIFISGFAPEPSWSNFATSAFYPAFWYRIMENMVRRASVEGRKFAVNEPIDVNYNFSDSEVELLGQQTSLRPDVQKSLSGLRVRYEERDLLPGFYELRVGDEHFPIAINFEPKESDFTALKTPEFLTLVKKHNPQGSVLAVGEQNQDQLQASLLSAQTGQELWFFFASLGLFFLITESLVSKFYKAENVQ